MNISAKTEYACIAILELAANYNLGQPLRVRSIASVHGIPSRFLVQILLQLKGAGLVSSVRGAAGGYQLIRDPSGITLGEVMHVVDGQGARLTSNVVRETPTSRALLNTWREIDAQQRQRLDSITFADLVERTRDQMAEMYYI